jgi:diguanylate cyclase (GGDEF)-like protein
MARTDPLTGLANRRAFFERAETAFERASNPETSPIVLMMVDIDHFKQINDSYGHAAGDAVLKHAGQTICNAVTHSERESDCLVARVGGEEFAVLLTGNGARAAIAVAEGICRLVRRSALSVGEVNVTATVSVGVAARAGTEMVDAVMSAPDRAVYEAKRAGRRDRWTVAAPASSGSSLSNAGIEMRREPASEAA